MAKCPNCQKHLSLVSEKCEGCGAVFEGLDGWKPLPETEAERTQMATLPVVQPVELLRPNAFSVALAVAALLLYLVALFEPALLFERREPLPGHQVLLWGWWGALAGSVAWYANILLLLAVRYFMKGYPGRAAALCVLALGLAFTSPLAKEWWFSEAAGTKIAGLGMGYKYWLGSLAIFLAASLVSVFRKTSAGQGRHEQKPT